MNRLVLLVFGFACLFLAGILMLAAMVYQTGVDEFKVYTQSEHQRELSDDGMSGKVVSQ